ncbi:hypothetical protein AVEN_144680-1 [Araneus ventricosus]|uniref:Uncharacterized protein n=1 Tax=Araneus ventricosus TaxID=182803 RepID=A0A4Y2Q7C1_ARAVE|nr:hypothetical protein AVEN_144680-1 [Araneus ventricosus]
MCSIAFISRSLCGSGKTPNHNLKTYNLCQGAVFSWMHTCSTISMYAQPSASMLNHQHVCSNISMYAQPSACMLNHQHVCSTISSNLRNPYSVVTVHLHRFYVDRQNPCAYGV